MSLKYSLVILILNFSFLASNAQSFLSTEGQNIVNEEGEEIILRGMGLGGWMLMEGYMMQTAGFANSQRKIKEVVTELIGQEDSDLFFQTWLENHVTKEDIDALKSWGFNSVRLPMHYDLFTLPIEEEPVPGEHTWLEQGFEMTDNLIEWCKENEMYVILDLHAAPGGQGYDEGISDYDPSKPSLWESGANKEKTIALWARLAERYKDEPIVGGYDLINEPNWDLPNNADLKSLYLEITDAIRAVDQKHIIFIEGNWFANDFTNLTPPWDDNLVYSPHKYWSINDQASIQWVLDIREEHNVPLYFGESGENSNVWFRDAIKLIEDNNIGWAWWPMKKIESIAGPTSIVKTSEYQSLLDYWSGTGTNPGASMAKTTLMELAEGAKLTNCIHQPDVIDAMFRQVQSDDAIPFRIHELPGIVYATDYDMGVLGSAYFDTDVANYQVSTGNFTTWNQGWSYRNDGVDIEPSLDVNSNGYNVGWLNKDEWMQYEVFVAEDAVYDIDVNFASDADGGAFHFNVGDAELSKQVDVASTGGWQNWQTTRISNVVLSKEDKKIRYYVDGSGLNLSSFNFIEKGPSTDLSTAFVSAFTLDENTVQMNVNKPLSMVDPNISDFDIYVNGTTVGIDDVLIDAEQNRIIKISVNHSFRSSDLIKISYKGSNIEATDETVLVVFNQNPVKNTIAIIHQIPGRIEAEDYFDQTGIQLEDTQDTGGGQNIGYLDPGDFADYYIEVSQAGTYKVGYRTAALSEFGALRLELIDPSGNANELHAISFSPTGDWQNWATSEINAQLPEGRHQIRVTIINGLFNINYMDFDFLNSTPEFLEDSTVNLFPNPAGQILHLQSPIFSDKSCTIKLLDLQGRVRLQKEYPSGNSTIRMEVGNLAAGSYLVQCTMDDGTIITKKWFVSQ